MATHYSHAGLPFVVRGARYTLSVPYLDSSGTPTDPTTPDTEFSLDGGAFADCAEEVTTISGSNGMGFITLTGAETNGVLLNVAAKVASGPKTTLLTGNPRVLPVLTSGTLSAGSAGGGTLGTVVKCDLSGCIVKTTGGTGGGGTGGANNQARVIITYTSSTGAFTVYPNWETTPDATTTYDVLYTDIAANAPKANVTSVGDNTGGITGFERALRAITYGTVGGSPTPTNTTFTQSALTPAASVTDQFKGLILAFDKDTATTALRGQKTDITGNTSGGAFTFTALTTLPQSGDTFTIE